MLNLHLVLEIPLLNIPRLCKMLSAYVHRDFLVYLGSVADDLMCEDLIN